jgi:hypothetical protein
MPVLLDRQKESTGTCLRNRSDRFRRMKFEDVNQPPHDEPEVNRLPTTHLATLQIKFEFAASGRHDCG